MALIDNLLVWYKCDEASGNLLDSLSTYDLTDTNTVQASTGVISGSRKFNGTDEYFTRTSVTGRLEGSAGPWTIAFWFKASSNTQSNTYIFQRVHATLSTQIAVIYEYVNNTVELYVDGYSGTDPRTNSGITVADTNWHHLAYRKGASGASTYDKFLDGTKTAISASIDFTFPSSLSRIFMGASNGGNYCACEVDMFGVWGDAKSDSEITSLYNSGSGLDYPFSTGSGPLIRPRLIYSNLLHPKLVAA